MASAGVTRAKAAYAALNEGDPEPLAALFRPDTVWRGVERGFLWWRRAPS
jgi:ketosteroid isomerase-like protein